MRLRVHLHLILILCWVSPIRAIESSVNDSYPKLQINKFRFSKIKRKNYERLVIEFRSKGNHRAKPNLKISPDRSAQEATLFLDEVHLVGAIPEALINDSYVPKSSFLGPVSINTEGTGHSFSLRAFLKKDVLVDAFLLQNPTRLVLDAFPPNSARAEGLRGRMARRPSSVHRRVSHGARSADDLSGRIVCYPASQQVIATVRFHPQSALESGSSFELSNESNLESMLASTSRKSVETALCFPASSRLDLEIGIAPKGSETTYVQSEPGSPLASFSSSMARPLLPAMPTTPSPSAPQSLSLKEQVKNMPALVTSVTPGPSKLGSLLPPQKSVQRVSNASPQLLTAPPANSAVSSTASLPIPSAASPASAAGGKNMGNLLPPLK